MSDEVKRKGGDVIRMACLSLVVALMLLNASASSISTTKGRGKTVDDISAIFDAKCAMCHGKDGRGSKFGKSKGVPDFTDPAWQKTRTDTQIRESVTNGKNGNMPAWKNRLSASEISALVGKVRDFSH